MILAGDIAICVDFALALGFIVSYTLLAAWWRSPWGQLLMAIAALYAWSLGWIVGSIWFRAADPNNPTFRFAWFVVAGVVLAWMLALMLRTQLRPKPTETKEETHAVE